jgi:hypothetical protein
MNTGMVGPINRLDYKVVVEMLNAVWHMGLDDASERILPKRLIQDEPRIQQGEFVITDETTSLWIDHPDEHLEEAVIFPVYYRNDTNFTNTPCVVSPRRCCG